MKFLFKKKLKQKNIIKKCPKIKYKFNFIFIISKANH